MDKNELKLNILKILFAKNNKLNSLAIKREEKNNSSLFQLINEYTTFISDASMSEKIYCIMYDINNIPICPTCNKKLTFLTFQSGYLKTCNDMKCKRLNTVWKSSSTSKINNYNKIIEIFSKNYNEITIKSLSFVKLFINTRLNKTDNGRKHQLIDSKHYNNYSDILYSILYNTKNILPINITNYKWSERFYILLNNIQTLPVCVECGNKTKYVNIINGYQHRCSKKCANIQVPKSRMYNHLNSISETIINQNFTILNNKIEYKGLNNSIIQLKCNICSNTIEKNLSNGRWQKIICPICNPNSYPEIEIKNLLNSYPIKYEEHNRNIITPLELDFYIPSKNLAIEYNGLYWHSNKNKNYHLNKTNLCKNNNIQLLHIFENEWIEKPDIVKSTILNKLGLTSKKIYARKCSIKEIGYGEAKTFLINNHIQGCAISPVNIGLFFNDILVSLMTFGKRKITGSKINTWELLRYSTLLNNIVIGGASRLLKYFENKYKPVKLLTYADKRYSTGNLYIQLNFKLDHESKPNYWYCRGNKLYNRVGFQKHKLSKKLKIFDPLLSEWENMKNNGYDRIWDCGNYVFIKEY